MSFEEPRIGTGGVHDECWDLLPWLVTGRLAAAQRATVEAHLTQCAQCRAELAAQRVLHERMTAREAIAYSSAAPFEKLWSRIEEVDREMDPPVPDGIRDDAKHARPERSRLQPAIGRWLIAAMVVQAIGLAWLAAVILPRQPDWNYRTVSSPAAVTTGAPLVRVVFTREATIEDVQQMLARRGLVIVNGPSAADVFVLTRADAGNAASDEIVAQLRQEPLVRFVEPAERSP